MTPGCRAALAVVAALWGAVVVQAAALEQPTLLTEDDMRIGVVMTPEEAADAAQFCQQTLERSGVLPSDTTKACTCFPRQWEQRTNRLHRLALPISLDPNTPASRRDLALIMRQQGGMHEDRLRQLSVEFEAAARQALKACR